jgi:hypothetical protein
MASSGQEKTQRGITNPLYEFRIIFISRQIVGFPWQRSRMMFLEVVLLESVIFVRQYINRQRKQSNASLASFMTVLLVLLSINGHTDICRPCQCHVRSGQSCNHPVWHTMVLCVKCHVHRNRGEEVSMTSLHIFCCSLSPTFDEISVEFELELNWEVTTS